MRLFSYQGVLLPYQVLRLVRVRVREALYRASVAAEEAVEVGANLVALGGLEVMALCAASLEEVGALLGVTYGRTSVISSSSFQETAHREESLSKCRGFKAGRPPHLFSQFRFNASFNTL